MRNVISICLMAASGLLAAPAALADLIATADPTIRNHLCVGNDCADSEVYSTERAQLLLKGNNVELVLEDSSTLLNFPGDDWALQANQFGEGGLNQFILNNRTENTTPLVVSGTAPSNSLFLSPTGDLGMGTMFPGDALHVVDSYETFLRLQNDHGTLRIGHTSDRFVIGNTTTAQEPFHFSSSAPSHSFAMDLNGQVGLGTALPEERLHIVSVADNQDVFALFEAGGSGADAAFLLRQNGVTPTTWEFRNQESSGRLNVGIAGGNTPFKIDEMANNNLFKLGLNGQPDVVAVTGRLKVNNTQINVPDYVFAEDYALRPLADVARFIDAHSHLPEVPSAAEIARDGVDLTEMQMVLLKKVEELTLYTLDQQQQIAQQQAEIAALRAELLPQ